VIPVTSCFGDPGELDDQGIPSRLPTRIQLGGVAYVLVGPADPDDVGTLTRIRCVGPFEAAASDQADQADVVFLRIIDPTGGDRSVYRFEAAPTFQVQFEITERPQIITAADQRYRLTQVWQPSVYSSTTVVLFVADTANPAPEVVYAVDVSQTVVGDSIGEYRLSAEPTEPPEQVATAAEQAGLHPDLTIDGRSYQLVDVFLPAGSTRNGFVTLFQSTVEGASAPLLGRDVRRLELFIFAVEGSTDSSA
jgi:hypothetical protein